MTRTFVSLLWSTCFQGRCCRKLQTPASTMTLQSPTHVKYFKCQGAHFVSWLANSICSNISPQGKYLTLSYWLKHNKTNNNEKWNTCPGKLYWERYLTLSPISLGNSELWELNCACLFSECYWAPLFSFQVFNKVWPWALWTDWELKMIPAVSQRMWGGEQEWSQEDIWETVPLSRWDRIILCTYWGQCWRREGIRV